MKNIIFFDIDTQFDFMNPKGKLYVPNAKDIIPKLKLLTNFAKRENIPILSSVDAHIKDDPEFKIFPAHCQINTRGQKKIKEALLRNCVFVPRQKLIPKRLRSLIKKSNQIIFEKGTYTCFANPNVKPALEGIDTVFVYGVATDYCVKEACIGIGKLKIKTYLVIDAIKGVDKKGTAEALKLLKSKGVKFIKTATLMERLR